MQTTPGIAGTTNASEAVCGPRECNAPTVQVEVMARWSGEIVAQINPSVPHDLFPNLSEPSTPQLERPLGEQGFRVVGAIYPPTKMQGTKSTRGFLEIYIQLEVAYPLDRS